MRKDMARVSNARLDELETWFGPVGKFPALRIGSECLVKGRKCLVEI